MQYIDCKKRLVLMKKVMLTAVISVCLMIFLCLISAYILYKSGTLNMAGHAVSKIITVAGGLFTGYLCGRVSNSKKYLWGSCSGIFLFLFLSLGLSVFGTKPCEIAVRFVIIVISSFIGGILSALKS